MLVALFVAVTLAAACSDGTLEVADVDVRVHYPEGWTEVPPGIVKSQIEEQLEIASGEIRTTFETVIQEIDSGVVRAVAFSPITSDGFTETLFVSIEGGDADLDAASGRRVARISLLAASLQVDVTDVDLPIGPARRIDVFSEPQGGSPSHLIEYVVRLEDGRTFTLSGTAPTSDQSFAETMRVIAESLEAT